MDVNPVASQQQQKSKDKQHFSSEKQKQNAQQVDLQVHDNTQTQNQKMEAEPPYQNLGGLPYDFNQYDLPTVKVPNNKLSQYDTQSQFWPNYYGGNFKVTDNYFLYRELSNEYTSNLASSNIEQQTDLNNPNFIKSDLTKQNLQNHRNLSQSNFSRQMSGFDNKSDTKYEDKDDDQQDQKNPRKPHLQGRFSGRLEKKEDEKRLVDECRMLAVYIGGQGKRGDKSRSTLAKIVRGIACGDVRRHLQDQANRTQMLQHGIGQENEFEYYQIPPYFWIQLNRKFQSFMIKVAQQKLEQLKYLRQKEMQELYHQQHLLKQELLKKSAIIGEYEKKYGQLQNIDLSSQLNEQQNHLQQVMDSQLMNNSMQTSHTHLSHWSHILGNGQNYGGNNHGQYGNILSSSNTPTEGQFKLEHVPHYIGPASTPGALSAPNTPHNYNAHLNLSQLVGHNNNYPWGSRHDMQNLSKTSSFRDVDFNGEGNGSSIQSVQQAVGQVALTAREAQAGAQQYNMQASKLQNIADEKAQQAKAQEQIIQQNNAQMNKLMIQADDLSTQSNIPDAQVKVYQQNIEEKLSNVNHQNQKIQQSRQTLIGQVQALHQEAEKARHKAQDLQQKANELNNTAQVLQANQLQNNQLQHSKGDFQSLFGNLQQGGNPNPLSRHNSIRVTEIQQLSELGQQPAQMVPGPGQVPRYGGVPPFSQPELSTGQVSSLQRQFSGHNISSISQQGINQGIHSHRTTPQTTPVQTPRQGQGFQQGQGQKPYATQPQRNQQGALQTMGSSGIDGQALSSNPSQQYLHSQMNKPRSFTHQNSNSNNSNPNALNNKSGMHHSNSFQSLNNQEKQAQINQVPHSQPQFPPPPSQPQRPLPHIQGITPLYNKTTEFISPRQISQQQAYNRMRKSQNSAPNNLNRQQSSELNTQQQKSSPLEPILNSMDEQNRQFNQQVPVYDPLVRHASINYPNKSNLVDRLKNVQGTKQEDQNLSFKLPLTTGQEYGGEGGGHMFRSVSMHKIPAQTNSGSEALLQQAYHDHNLMLNDQSNMDLGTLKTKDNSQQSNHQNRSRDQSQKSNLSSILPQAKDNLAGPQDSHYQLQSGGQPDNLMLLESPLQEVIHHTLDSDINQYLMSNNSDQQISFSQDIPRNNNNQHNGEDQNMDLSLHEQNQ